MKFGKKLVFSWTEPASSRKGSFGSGGGRELLQRRKQGHQEQETGLHLKQNRGFKKLCVYFCQVGFALGEGDRGESHYQRRRRKWRRPTGIVKTAAAAAGNGGGGAKRCGSLVYLHIKFVWKKYF